METIRRNQVLDEMDIRTLPNGKNHYFSIKFVTRKGKVVFIPKAQACGAGRMNNKEHRLRGVIAADENGYPIGHVYPVSIDAILTYNGREVVYSKF